MSKRTAAIFYVVIISTCLLFSITLITASAETENDISPGEKNIVEASNKFGFKLFREIVKSEPDKSIFISPLSISMALAMTYNGAEGKTKQAMAKTLELSGLSIDEVNNSYLSLTQRLIQLDPDVAFQIANSIWSRIGFQVEQDFIEQNKKYFEAMIRSLDFNNPQSVDTINNWVNEQTNGKITEIIQPPISQDVVMFLINAIYFKGIWVHEFDEEKTRDDMFNLPDGSTIPCRMMVQKNDFQYFENDDFQAIDLPYGNGKFSMTIFLPKPHIHIDKLIARFNQNNWNNWLENFNERKGTIHLPKFKLEYLKELKDVLSALGMGIAFSRQADFTRINKRGDLFISKVLHKTFIEVDEKGTEAAAVTLVEVSRLSVESSVFDMRVDRPFVFMIRDSQSQDILFMGKIVEPKFE